MPGHNGGPVKGQKHDFLSLHIIGQEVNVTKWNRGWLPLLQEILLYEELYIQYHGHNANIRAALDMTLDTRLPPKMAALNQGFSPFPMTTTVQFHTWLL